jgi:uncharacterized phage-associated protein
MEEAVDAMNSYFASGQFAEGEQTSFAMLAMSPMDNGTTASVGQGSPQATFSVAVQPLLDIDPRAAREVIVYLAEHLQDPSFHRIAKLLYFADKLHLQRYGRLILGDRYVAMQYGPVPGFVYDMLKTARNANSAGTRELQPAFTVRSDGRTVLPLRSADLDWISDSERECLDEVLHRYGDWSFQALTDLSHDEAWSQTEKNHFIPLERIAATIPDSESLLNHLLDPTP